MSRVFYNLNFVQLFSSDFSTDNSAPSTPAHGRGVETELQAARLGLRDEIERRKKAEEALRLMRNHWQGLTNRFAEVGLLFPVTSDAGEVIPYDDFVEGLFRQFVVERNVAEAMGKVLGQVEAEATSELILESKDQEISRLSNRLKYYEGMTHEMSQRNLETVGTYHIFLVKNLKFFNYFIIMFLAWKGRSNWNFCNGSSSTTLENWWYRMSFHVLRL